MARAQWNGHTYEVTAPETVGDLSQFFPRMRKGMDTEALLFVGFDFPIGLPKAYAEKVGVSYFLDLLPKLGTEQWGQFYDKCEDKREISLHRPFYPYRPGGTKQVHLTEALGISKDQLLRHCEKKTNGRRQACRLFWTLGSNQVGPAAIRGWRDLLAPAIRSEKVSLGFWPFQGSLSELFLNHTTIVAETYPTEAYRHVGFPQNWNGKTNQIKRRERDSDLQEWFVKRSIEMDDVLRSQIIDGFGSEADGEDRFDSLVGLCSMIEVILGHRDAGTPSLDWAMVEGWILGQDTNTTPEK
jgi:hypothetical protein